MSSSLEKGENSPTVGMDEDVAELARMGAHPAWLLQYRSPTDPVLHRIQARTEVRNLAAVWNY